MSFKVGCTIAATVVAVTYFQNCSRKPLNSTNLNVRVQHAQARILKTDSAAPVAFPRHSSIQQTTSITKRHQ